MASSKLTKVQFINAVSEGSGLDKRSVTAVLDSLVDVVRKELGADGPGEVTVPGFIKLKAKVTPATEDRPGVHPFTKEPITIKGKPASRKIRATPVKAFKDALG